VNGTRSQLSLEPLLYRLQNRATICLVAQPQDFEEHCLFKCPEDFSHRAYIIGTLRLECQQPLYRLRSMQLYGLTVSPGRHTHDRFNSRGAVNVAGSVIVIV
jgi:hypothetical protein